MDFRKYDNPEKALQVWNEYMGKGDIPSELANLAWEEAGKCRTANDLDIALDGIITGHSTIHICSSPPSPSDEDANGGSANARRFLED